VLQPRLALVVRADRFNDLVTASRPVDLSGAQVRGFVGESWLWLNFCGAFTPRDAHCGGVEHEVARKTGGLMLFCLGEGAGP
jgi:hypothetical protein